MLSKFALAGLLSVTNAYTLVSTFDHSNWDISFDFQVTDRTSSDPNVQDPTHGFVTYVSEAEAKTQGLYSIVNNQVRLGVDHTNPVANSDTSPGRNSTWLISKDSFTNGLLIGDFGHVPASVCGLWPAFWTINNGVSGYGEIDIFESFSDHITNFMTLHTGTACSFSIPASAQLGTVNNGDTNCQNGAGAGCSVKGPAASYGDPVNAAGGAVYAMEWTDTAIKIWNFNRGKIPADITSGQPNPSGWGLPSGNFDSKYGNCDISTAFPAQHIYFDTDFCGAEAGESGGPSWSQWTDCSARTGAATCEAYVAANPAAFVNAYWLINSVKLYQ